MEEKRSGEKRLRADGKKEARKQCGGRKKVVEKGIMVIITLIKSSEIMEKKRIQFIDGNN